MSNYVPRMLIVLLIALISMDLNSFVLTAPHSEKINDRDKVIVDDETLWSLDSDVEVPEGKPSSESKYDQIPVQNVPEGEENQERKNWYDATTTLFQKWGYTDEQIPHPFGSSHTTFKLTPEFTTILKGLVEKVPPELERDIRNILKQNTIRDMETKRPTNDGTKGNSASSESSIINASAKSGSQYIKICEAKDCAPEKINLHTQQIFEEKVSTFNQDEKSAQDDISSSENMTLVELHSNMTDKDIITEDIQAIQTIIDEVEQILGKNDEKQFVEKKELYHSRELLEELSALIHEVETIAFVNVTIETTIENQNCHCDCPKEKSTVKSEKTFSKNEELIMKELENTGPLVDETSLLEYPHQKFLPHVKSKSKSKSHSPKQDAKHDVPTKSANNSAKQHQGLLVEKVVADTSHIIKDIGDVAEMQNHDSKVNNKLNESNGLRTEIIHSQSQTKTENVNKGKVKALEKVIQDLHELATDQQVHAGRIENKKRLEELIHDLQESNSKSPDDKSGYLRIQTIIENLDKDSDIEFQLQRKLHDIDESRESQENHDLDDVVSSLKMLTKNDHKPSSQKFSQTFEDEVKQLETHEIKTLPGNQHFDSFNDELEKLKELMSPRHDQVNNHNQHQSELKEEINNLEEVIHENHNSLTEDQIKNIDEEIYLLEELESSRKHGLDWSQKQSLDKEIDKLRKVIGNHEKKTSSHQNIKIDQELKTLLHIISDVERNNHDHRTKSYLEDEIRKLEELTHNYGFSSTQKEILHSEIRDLQVLGNRPWSIDSNMKLALDKEINYIADLLKISDAPSPSKLNEEIEHLHEIIHPNPAPLSSSGRDHSQNSELLEKEVKELENLASQNRGLFDTKQRKDFDKEVEELHALLSGTRRDDISSDQIEALVEEVDKLDDLASQIYVQPSQKDQTVNEVIKHLHEISHLPLSKTHTSYQNKLDDEVKELSDLLTLNEDFDVLNYKQKQTLKEEIKELREVKNASPEQVQLLDSQIKNIQEFIEHKHPKNGDLNQMLTLDQEIKDLKQTSDTIQEQQIHTDQKDSLIQHNPHPEKVEKMVESLEGLQVEVSDLETKQKVHDIMHTLDEDSPSNTYANIDRRFRPHLSKSNSGLDIEATGRHMERLFGDGDLTGKAITQDDYFKKQGNSKLAAKAKTRVRVN